MNAIRKAWDVVTNILVVAIVILAILLVGARFAGFKVFTVLSGSMEPAYHTGSVTQGLYIMSVISYSIEPLISWARANKTVMSEIYLRLTCAAIYHNCGKEADAIHHIDRAIELALADRLYGVLAEYCRALDSLMEQRLSARDADAWAEVHRLYKAYNSGWHIISGAVRGRTLVSTLSPKQREVAKLAAFGLTNKEIAARMGMSLSAVKQALLSVTDKTGVSRDEFAGFL